MQNLNMKPPNKGVETELVIKIKFPSAMLARNMKMVILDCCKEYGIKRSTIITELIQSGKVIK